MSHNSLADLDDKLEKLETILARRGIEYTVNDGSNNHFGYQNVSVGNCRFTETVCMDVTPEGLPTYESFLTMEVFGLTPEMAVKLLDVLERGRQFLRKESRGTTATRSCSTSSLTSRSSSPASPATRRSSGSTTASGTSM